MLSYYRDNVYYSQASGSERVLLRRSCDMLIAWWSE